MKVYVVCESSEKFGNTVAGVFSSFDRARIFCLSQAVSLMNDYSNEKRHSGLTTKLCDVSDPKQCFYYYDIRIVYKNDEGHAYYEHRFYISEEELDECCTYEAVVG